MQIDQIISIFDKITQFYKGLNENNVNNKCLYKKIEELNLIP